MNHLLWGKAVETFGAFLLLVVAVRAAAIEFLILSPIRIDHAKLPSRISRLSERLENVAERRRKQFGPREVAMVGLGTLCVFFGCVWYLIGILLQHH